MDSVAADKIVFNVGPPSSMPGQSAISIPVSGWVRLNRQTQSELQVCVDNGTNKNLHRNPPLPPAMQKSLTLGRAHEAFSGWITLPGAEVGKTHITRFFCNDEFINNTSYETKRSAVQADAAGFDDKSTELAICMAVYEPDETRFVRQIDSIINQSYEDWVCFVNDDGSSEETVDMMQQVLQRDSRFRLYRNNLNQGFYGNFETAIARVTESIKYIALADQDDYWYADKLNKLVSRIESDDCALVYSDMRITDADRNVIAPSYWNFRKNSYQDLEALLIANTVTGAACLFKSELRSVLLPFPIKVGDSFHDHWIACCAMASGGISYVDEPLYDYIQYDNSVIGHCGFEFSSPTDAASIRLRSIFNPKNWKSFLGRFIGSSLAVYWQECRRIEAICKNLKLRVSALDDSALDTFSGGMRSVYKLLKAHLRLSEPRRLTNNAELRLARGYFVYTVLLWFPGLRGF